MFKFCPACGGQLPQAALIKYCPFCGTGLSALTGAGEVRAVVNCVRKAEVIRQEQVASRQEHHYYSVILKACSNQDQLAHRLCQVLRRSLTATRMAVAMTPCIVIYKGKAADTQPVLAIFQEEKLPYGIIEGDFNSTSTVDSLIPNFGHIERSAQDLLRSTPAALWLGDGIKSVCCHVGNGTNTGVLALSDKNVYYVSSTADGVHWYVISFAQIAGAEVHDDRYGATLELMYHDLAGEEIFHFADEEEAARVYRFIMEKTQ